MRARKVTIGFPKFDTKQLFIQILTLMNDFMVPIFLNYIPVNPFENLSFLLQATYVPYTCHFHEDRDPHSFLLYKIEDNISSNFHPIYL